MNTNFVNVNCACVFPETRPDEQLLFPLLQVFSQLVHIQAIENEAVEEGAESAFVVCCRQQERLIGCTPVPLGTERERFCSLIGDMRRGETYTSQLNMLILADINRRDPAESGGAIRRDLLKRGEIGERDETDVFLWQSRLILKLGEWYDLDQADLSRALQTIEAKQESLLAELCEDADTPFAVVAGVHNASRGNDSILRHRLKAWTRLCFSGSHDAPGIPITQHSAAMELLQDVYEKLSGHSARWLISLEIPLLAPDQVPDLTTSLVQHCPKLHQAIRALADNSSSRPPMEDIKRLLVAGQMEWAQCLSPFLPLAAQQRSVLDLFLFPEMSAAKLFAESFAGGVLPGADRGRDTTAGAVVGLLRMG
jgi:hypothetical protein